MVLRLTSVNDTWKVVGSREMTRAVHAVGERDTVGYRRLSSGDVRPRKHMSSVLPTTHSLTSWHLIVRIVGLWYSPRGLRW
jgi:hypothetical protein